MTPGFFTVLAGLGTLLVLATMVAGVARRCWPSAEKARVCLRIYTWWAIVVVVGGMLAAGEMGVWLLAVGMAVLAAVELWRLTPGRPWQCAWLTVAVAVACAHLGGLYELGNARGAGMDARLLVLGVLLLIALNDVAQYLWGRSLGRHKLAPRLSPGKTVEGAAGGVVTTVVLAWCLGPVLGVKGMQALVLGAVISGCGIAGDLAISALKRRAAVKDSGTLLPGHGGLLDRIDSLLLAGPGVFYTLCVIWRHP